MTEPAKTARLEARSISVGYSGREIISDLTLSIPSGTFTALLGPNGCGKSTCLRALAGLLPPRRGHVLLDGKPLSRVSRTDVARHLTLLPQSPRAPEDIRVRDLVAQGRYPHRRLFDAWSAADEAACEEALRLTDMTAMRQQPLGVLSGGQRQRAWIAMTLAQGTEILLLDEPTTFLDISHQLDVMELLRMLVRERKKTIVAVLHDINQATRFADEMILLKNGTISAFGSPSDVMRAETIGDVFDIDATIIVDPIDQIPMCLPRRR